MNFWTFGLSSLDLTISASMATARSKPIMRKHTGSSIRSQQTALGLKKSSQEEPTNSIGTQTEPIQENLTNSLGTQNSNA